MRPTSGEAAADVSFRDVVSAHFYALGNPTVDVIGDFSRGGWWHTPGDNMKIISTDSLDISMRVTIRVLGKMLK